MSGSEDRDKQVSGALSLIETPEHRPGFWEDFESALRAETGSGLAPVRGIDGRANRRLWLMTAAALVAGALAASALLIGGDGEQGLDVGPADPSPATEITAPQPDPSPDEPPSTTRPGSDPSAAPRVARSTPDEAVISWVEALGRGDLDTAVSLVGPRTESYYEALGGNLRGVMAESQEGYGAWATRDDRSTTEVDLGAFDGSRAAVVVISGTWRGEGGPAFRHEALVAVELSRGRWAVEPAAFNPDTGGRIEMISPSPAENGWNGLAASESLEASAAGSGTFHFSLDDNPAVAVKGQRNGSGVTGRYDPPGEMTSQTHLLVVAYIDGSYISAVAGTFAVEG